MSSHFFAFLDVPLAQRKRAAVQRKICAVYAYTRIVAREREGGALQDIAKKVGKVFLWSCSSCIKKRRESEQLKSVEQHLYFYCAEV